MQTLTLKFPETNFQPLLAQIPGLGVDAVGAFFAGGGAVAVPQGIQGGRPQGAAGRLGLPDRRRARPAGCRRRRRRNRAALRRRHRQRRATTPSARPSRPRPAATPTSMPCRATTQRQLLAIGLDAVKGKIEDEANLYKAMREAKFDSPRGPVSCRQVAGSRAQHLSAQGRPAARTRWSASPPQTSPTPAPAASWPEPGQSALTVHPGQRPAGRDFFGPAPKVLPGKVCSGFPKEARQGKELGSFRDAIKDGTTLGTHPGARAPDFCDALVIQGRFRDQSRVSEARKLFARSNARSDR